MAIKKYITEKKFEEDFVKMLESNSINFLLGAGFSAPILKTLGNLEKVMEITQKNNEPRYKVLEAILYWHLFNVSIYPMKDKATKEILINQIKFIKQLKKVLLKRESATLLKQINIFTTNYDVFLEVAFEEANIDYNDGFIGRITPYFSTAHYNRIYQKQVLFSSRLTEVPVINLFKIHGSVTWKKRDENTFIYGNHMQSLEEFYTQGNSLVQDKDMVREICQMIDGQHWNEVTPEFVATLVENISVEEEELEENWIPLVDAYQQKFKIVNPTKQKFSDTLLDKNYYELLRIYSNELEKTNSVLLVFGFSFADEHIQEITTRAINNPSLIMIIFAYQTQDICMYEEKFALYNNVWIVSVSNDSEMQESDLSSDEVACTIEETKLDLSYLNSFLEKIYV